MRILSEFIQEDTKILTIQINKNEEIEIKRKKRSNKANAYNKKKCMQKLLNI